MIKLAKDTVLTATFFTGFIALNAYLRAREWVQDVRPSSFFGGEWPMEKPLYRTSNDGWAVSDYGTWEKTVNGVDLHIDNDSDYGPDEYYWCASFPKRIQEGLSGNLEEAKAAAISAAALTSVKVPIKEVSG